jgi:hypothetical protein
MFCLRISNIKKRGAKSFNNKDFDRIEATRPQPRTLLSLPRPMPRSSKLQPSRPAYWRLRAPSNSKSGDHSAIAQRGYCRGENISTKIAQVPGP